MSIKRTLWLVMICLLFESGTASDRLYLDAAAYIMNNSGICGEGVGLANPAASYCVEMGYEYEIIVGPKGQHGVCRFPDGLEADAWAFFEGREAKEYSYCARQGYDIKTIRDGRSSFSQYCAVCVDKEGREIGAVEELLELKSKVIKATISRSRLDSLAGPPPKPLRRLTLIISGEELIIKKESPEGTS